MVSHRLQAGASRVWDVMAQPGALALYHPFCAANPVTKWPGVGARDTISYLSGVVLNRRFTAWDEGRGYELEIGNDEWPVSRVRWELTAKDAEESELTISVWPSAFSEYPTFLMSLLHRWYLVPLLRRYLRSVLRGLDHYLTTGHKVVPNQFGRVWLFSYGLSRSRGGGEGDAS